MRHLKKKISLAGVFALLFLLLIVLVKTVDIAPVGAAGTEIGLSHINSAFHGFFGVKLFWYELTEIFGVVAILTAAAFALFGFCQLVKRKSLKKVDREILVLACLYIAVIILYAFFEKVIVNYRPILMPGINYPEASFPSSHTMLIITVMASAFMLLGKYIKSPGLRTALQVLCWVIVVLTVIGRLICGVHWLTDILGGVLLSAALLLLFSAFLKKE